MKVQRVSLVWHTYDARCQDCDWRQAGKTALGLAAIHHNRSGHTVCIEGHSGITYCRENSPHYQRWLAMKQHPQSSAALR